MTTVNVTNSDSLSEILKTVRPHTRIVLAPGFYEEKLEISVPDIEIVGHTPEDTGIIWHDYAKKLDENGVEYVTFRTYTVAVLAPRVTFRNLSVINNAGSPEINGQEVALTVYADEFLAENCEFTSTQDTIFCGPLPPDLIERYDGFLKDSLRTGEFQRHIFRNCVISGNVDFIFGCGDALFEDCEIRSIYDVRGHGYVAAPAHALEQEIGFVFSNCRFTNDNNVAPASIYLARPWRDYGKCSFIGCEYGGHINPEGFDKWNDTNRDKTARFAEYGVTRPSGRVSWSRELSAPEKDALLNYFKKTK